MEGKGIELDNIVRIPSTTDTIFRRWLEFLSPFHHLTGREMDVATALLKERYALSKVISDNDLLERINKLDAFMKKRDENGVRVIQKMGLTEAAIHLMSRQLELEKELNDVLVARYSIFDVKKGE